MKTIKSIKKTKEVELGEIKRVDDKTAHNTVGSVWAYVSKSEWKMATRKQVENQVGTKSEPSQDQVEKKPYKKGSKPDKKSKKDEKNS
jgi:hypothetical protein